MGRFHAIYKKLHQVLDGMPYDEIGISDEVKEQVSYTFSLKICLMFFMDFSNGSKKISRSVLERNFNSIFIYAKLGSLSRWTLFLFLSVYIRGAHLKIIAPARESFVH